MSLEILYSGQVRFAEAAKRQAECFKDVNHNNIFSVLDYLQDSHSSLSLKSTHMIEEDKTFEFALDHLKNKLKPTVVDVYNRSHLVEWYKSAYKVSEEDNYKVFYIQHIYSFIQGLKKTKSEVVISITTDLIVEGDINAFLKNVTQDKPKVWVHRHSDLITPHVIALNRPAIDTICQRGDEFLNNFFNLYSNSEWERSEKIWELLFEFCNIEFNSLSNIYQCKIRPLMTINDVDKSINQLSMMFKNWRQYKDISTNRSNFKFEKSKVTRIVAYGCSYTAGDEFLDYQLNPDAEKIKREKGIEAWFKIKESYDPLLRKKLIEKQKLLAWPAILANKLQVELSNRSEGANSLPNILYQIEHDISEGLISDTDLVFVGLTSIERSIYFGKQKSKAVLLKMKEQFPLHLQDYQAPIIEFKNAMYMFYFYYLCWSRLIQISEKNLNNKLLIVPCINDGGYKHFKASFEEYFKKDIARMQQECLSHPSFITDKNLYDFVNDKSTEIHGCGHPTQIVHNRFVENILKVLKDSVS